jgi:hypothetical protein
MGVTFTKEGANRIAAAVRKVERTPQDRAGDRAGKYETATEFWALLIGSTLDGFYSFFRVAPDPARTAPMFTLFGQPVPWTIQGEIVWDAAREVNDNRGVPFNSVVRLTFTGYDRDGNPQFVFFYPAMDPYTSLPPHDHRDIFNGGLAFAMMHPGTSLPQMPWAA